MPDSLTARPAEQDLVPPERLSRDARTAWAYYIYKAHGNHPPISSSDATLILGELEQHEHVEALLPGALITRRERIRNQHRLAKIPTTLTVITMSRTCLLPRNGMISIERERGRGGRVPGTVYIRCSITPSKSKEELLLYAPGEMIKDILANGAGLHILKLPPQPGVPDMPSTTTHSKDQPNNEGVPSSRLLTGWRSAEETAFGHLRAIGFANIRLTSAGSDSGIDVLGTDIAAQVKMTALPVGRPVLQQLLGASRTLTHRACYSTSGYTQEAKTFADSVGMALFTINEASQILVANPAAAKLERTTADSQEARAWRAAYKYKDEVIKRASKWFTDDFLDAVEYRRRWKNRRQLTLTEVNSLDKSLSYVMGAIEALATETDFRSGSEMTIHHHHAELLFAVGLRAQGLDYSNPPRPTTVETNSPLENFYQVPEK